ncbi:MAG: TorF family putative porin [Azonexus sp.]|jgi:uncharacterized protein (TIGR02001 family)|nr:TorF family putative porin [Azonexus sp.]
MKKSLIALALVGVFAVPAFAEEAAPTPEHTLTGNLGLFTSYRFRGIDQTFGKPALQGGFDYSHSSGIYLGNWNSNVSQTAGYPDGNLEMDFYGGYKTTFGDFGLDVGGLYYYYPGSRGQTLGLNRGAVDNGELYIAGTWKFLTLKYSYAVTDYFSLPDSDGSSYLELNAAYDLGNGWGINGHAGHLWLKNYSVGDYTDWKLGVTKDIGGFVIGLSYVDTNADKTFYTSSAAMHSGGDTKNLGRATAVLSVSKTF